MHIIQSLAGNAYWNPYNTMHTIQWIEYNAIQCIEDDGYNTMHRLQCIMKCIDYNL